MKKTTHLMTEGDILPLILKYSVPLLLGNMLQQSYQLIDLMIVGRCIHDNGISVAAVGMGSSFINMMIGFFVGITSGAGIVIANAFGKRDEKKVLRSIKVSVILAACLSVFVSILSILSCDRLLTVANTTPDIFKSAGTYLKVYYVGFMPLFIYNMCTAILQALGDSKSPFKYLFISCVLNLILDYIFMGVLHLGVEGAAGATVICEMLSMIISLRKVYMTAGFDVQKDCGCSIEADTAIVAKIVKFGIPIAVQQMTINLSNLIIQGYINKLGTDVIAAFGIYGKIDGYILLPMFSFSIAVTTFTGQNFGAGNIERINRGKKTVLILSAAVTAMLSLILMISGPFIVELFADSDSITLITVQMINNLMPFYCILAVSKTYSGIFNALGKSAYSSVTTVICLCIVRIVVLSIAFKILEAITAIYIAYIISWILLTAVIMVEYWMVVPKILNDYK